MPLLAPRASSGVDRERAGLRSSLRHGELESCVGLQGCGRKNTGGARGTRRVSEKLAYA